MLAECAPAADAASAASAMAALGPRLPIDRGDAARGAALFDEHCQRCHAPDVTQRSSRIFRSYPRLDCPDYLDTASDRYLFAVISAGGEAVGKKSVMTAFGQTLDERAIADLVAFLRSTPAR